MIVIKSLVFDSVLNTLAAMSVCRKFVSQVNISGKTGS